MTKKLVTRDCDSFCCFDRGVPLRDIVERLKVIIETEEFCPVLTYNVDICYATLREETEEEYEKRLEKEAREAAVKERQRIKQKNQEYAIYLKWKQKLEAEGNNQ
jgi:hypothetical protein